MKKKQNKIIVADTETGELHELTPLKLNKPVHIDKKQKFIKFYYNLINILPTLSKAELTIIKSICENLKPNKIQVVLTSTSTNLPHTTFKSSINKLKSKQVLKSTTSPQIFEISHDFMFNGTYYCDTSERLKNALK
jgi:hypothetical protein